MVRLVGLVFVAVTLLPLVSAYQVSYASMQDPFGDESLALATPAAVAPLAVSACHAPSADIQSMSLSSDGASLRVGLFVADATGGLVCVGATVHATDADARAVTLTPSPGSPGNVASVRFVLDQAGQRVRESVNITFRDGAQGTLPATVGSQPDLDLSVALVGTATLTTGPARAYDLGGMSWSAIASTQSRMNVAPVLSLVYSDEAGPLAFAT